MHEMQTIVTDDCGVCQSVVRGHSVLPLPNHFGLLFAIITVTKIYSAFTSGEN